MMNSFQKILHPSDFSAGDEGAWIHALKIALAAKGKLNLLHCSESREDVHWSDFPHVRPTLERWGVVPKDCTREDVAKTGAHISKLALVGKDPVEVVLEYVEQHGPGLIVLATHQRQGLSRWLHDAIAEPVARKAHTKTLFVPRRVMGFVSRETGEISLNHVVIPIAGSPRPQPAVDAAFQLVDLLGAADVSVSLVHIGNREDMPEVTVPNERERHVGRIALSGESVVEHVLAFSEECNADLIVMSTQGHKGFLDALRGRTTEQILRGTKCPVLAVPE